MPLQPCARRKIGTALATPASNSASSPGFTSICAISSTMSGLQVRGECRLRASLSILDRRKSSELSRAPADMTEPGDDRLALDLLIRRLQVSRTIRLVADLGVA